MVNFFQDGTFREKLSHDLLGETIVIIFAEMANFSKRLEECVSDTDKMLYVLKNIGKMMNQPGWLQHEIYTRLFDACEIAGFTEDKRIEYEKIMYDEKRLKSEMETARRIGHAEESRSIALRMLAMGLTVEQVAQATMLTIEEITQLKS